MLKFGIKYISRYKLKLFIYIFLTICIGTINMFSPFISGKIIDAITAKISLEEVFLLCFIWTISQLINFILKFISNYFFIILQTNSAFTLNKDLILHIQKLPLNEISEFDTASLNQRINNDSNSIVNFTLSLTNELSVNTLSVFVHCYYYIT